MLHLLRTTPSIPGVASAMLVMACLSWDTAQASPVQDFQRALQRLDRQLCAKLPGAKCRKAATRPAARQGDAKKAAARPSSPMPNEGRDTAPAESSPPIPKLKPELKARAAPAPGDDVVLPRLKPDALATAPEDSTDVPRKSDRRVQEPQRRDVAIIKPERKRRIVVDPGALANPMPDGTLSGEACIAALRNMNVNFSQAATPVSSGPCTVYEPIRLNGMKVGGNAITFPDKPLLTCGFAARFAYWVAQEGAPAVRKAKGSALRSVGTGPGYQCRGRNGDMSAKLSEHAYGNAVDIEYIKTVDGETVQVQAASATTASNARLLKELRSEGCRYFTTVLGPGTNSAHARHFHFDLERRGKKGSHKLCE